MEAILADEARPVDDADLRILELAAATLADSSVWDREDDRVCAETDTTYSLFCALQLASIETPGAYEHRRTVMQEVRFAIERARPGVEYEHRLMDFNNAPTTTLADARGVLTDAAERARERLDRQARCGR